MNLNIITSHPNIFTNFLNESIIKRAQEKKIVKINIFNLRNWAQDKHNTIDDAAYGIGHGMILKPDVIDRALYEIKNKHLDAKHLDAKILLTSPKGKIFDQSIANKYAKISNLIIVCGHYSGVDERVVKLVDETISIGNFVMTGGEIPAMAIADTIIRLLPKVINKQSLANETHSSSKMMQYPQYTRPRSFIPSSINKKAPLEVPKILLSGNHEKIAKWQKNNLKFNKL
jgi:tRNA (guanine37-N1)-methyltransferase